MLEKLPRNLVPSERPLQALDGTAGTIDLDTILAGARRQFKIIAVTTIVVVLLGLGYLIAATPLYTSTVDILL